jgi:probable addiction module antidote protein
MKRGTDVEKVTFTNYDPAEYIETKKDVLAHLEVAVEENDPAFLLRTIGHIARSKGMAKLARDLNLDRAGLYKAFSAEGNPSFLTIMSILDNLGYGISIYQKKAS